MLRPTALSWPAVLGGTAAAVGAHVVAPVVFFSVLSALAVVGLGSQKATGPIRELHVVEARFVKLGEKRDPRKLPNRRVPRLQTAPDLSTVVSKNLNPDPPKKRPDAGTRPPNPKEDPLTRLGDRAQAFAEMAKEREQEGDPDGVEWGTATEAREGDIYRGKLAEFWRRGWTVPTTMDRSAIQSLATWVMVEILPDRQVGPFRVERSSGNPLFDQSVIDRLQGLRHSRAQIPEPPPEVADQYLGRKIIVRFKGIDAR